MFSLIITIISIALVSALALATLYYGGQAFNSGYSLTEASKIVNQAQQLLGAATVFQADYKRPPHDLAELTSLQYLSNLPTNGVGAWTSPVADQTVFMISSVASLEICKLINLRGSLGRAAILKQAYPLIPAQCFGPDEAHLRAVFKQPAGPTSLDGALATTDIAPGAVPLSSADPAWLVAP
jgi:hypothetical protein